MGCWRQVCKDGAAGRAFPSINDPSGTCVAVGLVGMLMSRGLRREACFCNVVLVTRIPQLGQCRRMNS